jgi:Na+-translocating ferredoxin:NAD+ oxidoreductase RnfD subunit
VIALCVLVALEIALGYLGMERERVVRLSFLTLACARLWHVFNMREQGSEIIRNVVTANKFVWGALILCSGLLLGALYLIYKGWVRWQVPLAYLATVAVGAAAFALWKADLGTDLAGRFIAYHLLGGGLALGALFMATDMVTSPLTNKGLWIFGFGCGVLTILIRLYGGYPEAVCYSILLMNTAVPLIDRWTQPRIFGHKK